MQQTASGTELVTLPSASALAVFTTDGAIDPLLEKIRHEIDAFVPDITTATGRKAVASMAYKVARAKTYLDDAGKELAAEQKKIPAKIDATRKRIRDTLDAWKDEVRQSLTAWEEAEEKRVADHKAAVASLDAMARPDAGTNAETLSEMLDRARRVVIDDRCQEFTADYAKAKDNAVRALEAALIERQTYEAQQAELARLRAEDEARRRREHEERIAREAAEKATREAEAKAEARRKAAEDAARREREAAEKRERDIKAAAEAREREIKAEAEKAIREAAEAAQRKQREEAARVEQEKREAERRAADREHRASINREVLAALKLAGATEQVGKRIVEMIATGNVPHVTINY